jgi:hypothetical protein
VGGAMILIAWCEECGAIWRGVDEIEEYDEHHKEFVMEEWHKPHCSRWLKYQNEKDPKRLP